MELTFFVHSYLVDAMSTAGLIGLRYKRAKLCVKWHLLQMIFWIIRAIKFVNVIKHHNMLSYGGVEVKVHAFLNFSLVDRGKY
jgi:hypothetical protein